MPPVLYVIARQAWIRNADEVNDTIDRNARSSGGHLPGSLARGIQLHQNLVGGSISNRQRHQRSHGIHGGSGFQFIIELLTSLGVKVRQRYGKTSVTLGVKKLPALVGQLIHKGWRVEADGKLYRTASNFDISVLSGIDWFELCSRSSHLFWRL